MKNFIFLDPLVETTSLKNQKFSTLKISILYTNNINNPLHPTAPVSLVKTFNQKWKTICVVKIHITSVSNSSLMTNKSYTRKKGTKKIFQKIHKF